jgi:hypothetical protein
MLLFNVGVVLVVFFGRVKKLAACSKGEGDCTEDMSDSSLLRAAEGKELVIWVLSIHEGLGLSQSLIQTKLIQAHW